MDDLTVSMLEKCRKSLPAIQMIVESTTDDEGKLFEALNLHDQLQQIISKYEEMEVALSSAVVEPPEKSDSPEEPPRDHLSGFAAAADVLVKFQTENGRNLDTQELRNSGKVAEFAGNQKAADSVPGSWHGGIISQVLIAVIVSIVVSVLLFILAFYFLRRKAKKKDIALQEDTSRNEITEVHKTRSNALKGLESGESTWSGVPKGLESGESTWSEVPKGLESDESTWSEAAKGLQSNESTTKSMPWRGLGNEERLGQWEGSD
ncbi:TOM1-like protein 2 [Camellia lanceoleosa]|uniref:TOM1-like protein 2 n=1 Tax=Camellia lanceoleosa TaxID=1840588 RepID=A0ACC0GI54_9ERIC|nr:TOM1-like protein 2 [Camellia lanceoleosa]